MPIINKEQLLALDDTHVEEVFVPEWKDSVYVRTVSAEVMDSFQLSIMSDNDNDRSRKMANFRARLVSITLCDEQGNPIMDERDARKLGKKSTRALDRIAEAARRLNGITPENEEELLDVTVDTAKNSEDVQGEDSSTD